MLTNLFISLGWSRDDAKWLWGRIVGASAALLMFAAMPASAFAALLPPAASTLIQHLVTAHPNWTGAVELAAITVLWLSGRYDSSTLPGKVK